ncbi:murein biosynthesis integral membrane protein MurJ [Clostridium cylindrosporum]|uniref:Probable lipid II flippase MurJ n=1 Tax=Clostridium cylindrosporum DSM 605 TaxID=1121307 RepID=A0A0J8D9K6_CLOCY|nr:murein biosynthesis integral membrane protein MurJ [Clostridium cylindrosporum]KMT22735.1 murein biosynthesis integral membrane protein MurJ [Clostridium cylindrosporum DSM 605]
MKETAILLMVATVISKVLGFAREIVLAYFYGVSATADAYKIAITIPGTIFAMIGAGIATGYIPMYSRIEKDDNVESANRFTSNMINFVLVICTIIVVIGLVFTTPIVKLFAAGFKGETLRICVLITRFTIAGVYFTALVYIFTGYLNLKNKFLMPALVAIPMNIVVIATIAISSKTSIEVLAIGTLLSIAIQLVFLLPVIKKTSYKHKLILDRKDKNLKRMVLLAIPVIIGISVNQINVLVDRTIASLISNGAIAALDYAVKLNGFVQGIFVMSIVTAMYPMISRMGAENNIEGLKKSLNEAIISVSLLVIPATVGAMVFAKPIVKLLFERGAFDSNAATMTSGALFFYSIGMIGYGLREVISKAFYSLQDTKTPMINAAFAVVINIILCITLSRFMGINGLALATSIAGIICTITLFISLRRRIGSIRLKSIVSSMIKILVTAVIMGIVSRFSYTALQGVIGESISLLLAIVIAGVVYLVVIYFMRIEEVNSIIAIAKSKIKRK